MQAASLFYIFVFYSKEKFQTEYLQPLCCVDLAASSSPDDGVLPPVFDEASTRTSEHADSPGGQVRFSRRVLGLKENKKKKCFLERTHPVDRDVRPRLR